MLNHSLNRRGFIKGTAAAAIATSLTGGTAWGAFQSSSAGAEAIGESIVPAQYPDSNRDSTKEFIVGQEINPTTLNPALSTNAAFQNIHAHILEQLIVFNADGTSVSPWLAESMQWIDDLTLELTLRQGIEFSNGEPFDAASAKFSIGVFAASKYFAGFLPDGVYDDTEIVDDHTIHIKLLRPFAPFTSFLARGGAAFPPAYYQEVGEEEFGQHPIGTGPFVLQEWAQDDRIVLERSDDYWNGPHPFSKVTYKIIPENTSRLAAIQADEIHLSMFPIDALDTLEASSTAEAVSRTGFRKFALFFDTKTGLTPELSDSRVRLAMNLAVDKQAIVDSLYHGLGTPLPGQWLTHEEFGSNPDLEMFPYDPERARELLAEAGLPNGFEMQFTYRSPVHKELGEIVSSFLEQIGITVNQRGLEAGAFVKAQDEETIGPHQQGLLHASEPYYNLEIFSHGGRYEWHILSDEYTDSLEQAIQTTDREEQLAYYHRAAEILHEDPPALFLTMPHDLYGVGNKVQGFVPRRDQVLWLYDMDLED